MAQSQWVLTMAEGPDLLDDLKVLATTSWDNLWQTITELDRSITRKEYMAKGLWLRASWDRLAFAGYYVRMLWEQPMLKQVEERLRMPVKLSIKMNT